MRAQWFVKIAGLFCAISTLFSFFMIPHCCTLTKNCYLCTQPTLLTGSITNFLQLCFKCATKMQVVKRKPL